MQVNPRSLLLWRLNQWLFLLLFLAAIGLLAFLSQRHVWSFDWSLNQANTLQPETRAILDDRPAPLTLTAFVGRDDRDGRQRLERLLDRFLRASGADGDAGDSATPITVTIEDPLLDPARARELGIGASGYVQVRLGPEAADPDAARTELLAPPVTETAIAEALLRLYRAGERWVVFLSGHGERDPDDSTNTGYSQFAAALTESGLNLRRQNLVAAPEFAANTHLVIVAGVQGDLLAGEVERLIDFVSGGGALLWLQDPGPLYGLEPLARHLGLRLLPGTVVDANLQVQALLGIQSPAAVPIVDFPDHPLTEDLAGAVILPFARAMESLPEAGLRQLALLTTLSRSWAEQGPLAGDVGLDPDSGDRPGPLTVGMLLEPATAFRPGASAGGDHGRVVVIGDSDFLANAYLGAVANAELGRRLVNWLTRDEALLTLDPPQPPDLRLELNEFELAALAFGFLVVLPAAFLLGGLLTWWLRRRG